MNIHYYLVDRDFKIKQNIYRESSLKYKQVAQGRCKDKELGGTHSIFYF